MVKFFKRLFCKHENLRLAIVLLTEEQKRWAYRCQDCGKYVWKDHPLDCMGCKRLCYMNDGSASCKLEDRIAKICMDTERILWKTEAKHGEFEITSE